MQIANYAAVYIAFFCLLPMLDTIRESGLRVEGEIQKPDLRATETRTRHHLPQVFGEPIFG